MSQPSTAGAPPRTTLSGAPRGRIDAACSTIGAALATRRGSNRVDQALTEAARAGRDLQIGLPPRRRTWQRPAQDRAIDDATAMNTATPERDPEPGQRGRAGVAQARDAHVLQQAADRNGGEQLRGPGESMPHCKRVATEHRARHALQASHHPPACIRSARLRTTKVGVRLHSARLAHCAGKTGRCRAVPPAPRH